MNIKDMIKLAQDGYTASEVMALNKAGFTPDIIQELSGDNGPSLEEIQKQQEAEEARKKEIEDEKKAKEKEHEDLMAQLDQANKDIAALKKELEGVQSDNRGSDMGPDLDDNEDRLKSVTEYLSSIM